MKIRLTRLLVCAAIALFAVPASAMADQRPFQLMLGPCLPTCGSMIPSSFVVAREYRVRRGFWRPLFPKDSKVQLRGELLLVPRGGDVSDGEFLRKVKLLYIDTAGLLDVEFNESFHLLAGTSVGFRVGDAASIDGIGIDIAGVFRRIDVGITFGADIVVVPRRVRMQVLYTAGMMNILSDECSRPSYPIFSTPRCRRRTRRC